MNAPWWSHNLLPCLDIQQLARATGRWLGKSPVGKFRMTPGCHHGRGIRWCTEQLKEKQFGEKKKDVKKHISMWAIGLGPDSVIQHGAVEVPGSSGESLLSFSRKWTFWRESVLCCGHGWTPVPERGLWRPVGELDRPHGVDVRSWSRNTIPPGL